ncbi:BQ5605_C002g01287 [Microbotryum silenes-dioicae]|uniref:BQ5605_C002g01287 protein n=1 Tax=Microbotryum silenes-dioicae TaxID=796604 RepID=A0A2X0MT42_9BASI|nr:BQ5605_C002g01287 [Microbotryum silenes-dioicae]
MKANGSGTCYLVPPHKALHKRALWLSPFCQLSQSLPLKPLPNWTLPPSIPSSSSSTPILQDVQAPFGKSRLGGCWLYPSPTATAAHPGSAIVLGHGLGAVLRYLNKGPWVYSRAQRPVDILIHSSPRYAELFQKQGYTAVCFDYRGFGTSTGTRRQILDWHMQEEDWHAAILWTRGLAIVDPEQVGIFGSSVGGRHAIPIASQDKKLKAAISQCLFPFTNGFASALTLGFGVLPRLALLALRDALFHSEENHLPVKLAARPGQVALMNAHDAESGYLGLVPSESDISLKDEVAARVALRIGVLYPGANAKNVECPIYFAVCKDDTVAPAGPTLNYAAKAPRGETKVYNFGHFSIYHGAGYEEASKDYSFQVTRLRISGCRFQNLVGQVTRS